MESSDTQREVSPPASPTATSTLQKRLKWAVAIFLVALLSLAIWLLFTTEQGKKIQERPELLRDDVRAFVTHHPLAAPALYLGTYITIASLGVLPVWWLQILSGIGFGLWFGTFYSLIGATVSASFGAMISRWFAGDWFRRRVEAKMERLRKLDDLLGHNGFLLVMTMRLVHLLPFGLSNYAIGLLKISMTDLIVGTFLGSIPAIALSVGLGAGYRPSNLRFMASLATINVLLLLPMAARYWRPQWFRKIGVE